MQKNVKILIGGLVGVAVVAAAYFGVSSMGLKGQISLRQGDSTQQAASVKRSAVDVSGTKTAQCGGVEVLYNGPNNNKAGKGGNFLGVPKYSDFYTFFQAFGKEINNVASPCEYSFHLGYESLTNQKDFDIICDAKNIEFKDLKNNDEAGPAIICKGSDFGVFIKSSSIPWDQNFKTGFVRLSGDNKEFREFQVVPYVTVERVGPYAIGNGWDLDSL